MSPPPNPEHLRTQVQAIVLEPASSGAADLVDLEGRLLDRYFRLQDVERNLAALIRRKRTGGPRQALAQVERERERLGRELHTGVGQMLAAIRLQLEIVDTNLPSPPGVVPQEIVPEVVRDALGKIGTLAMGALDQVRSLSRWLHPPEWQRLTLDEALRQLWELSGIPQRYESSLRIDPLPQEPDLDVKILLYRAAQEALSNVTRHSRATSIQMALDVARDRLTLTIRDNGVGFDPQRLLSTPANISSGIGLRSIREQVAALGGKMTLDSGPDGTRLEISTPLSPEAW